MGSQAPAACASSGVTAVVSTSAVRTHNKLILAVVPSLDPSVLQSAWGWAKDLSLATWTLTVPSRTSAVMIPVSMTGSAKLHYTNKYIISYTFLNIVNRLIDSFHYIYVIHTP